MLSAEAKSEGAADATFQPGQLVDGKYRVERLLGMGGMAAVWAGTNERTGKRVALKVILRSLAGAPAARELFYTEGLVASRVNHPNVVTMFDAVDHEGMTCMVMELLDGEPLSRFLERKGVLMVHEAASLLLPAMRGVAAAHAQGVIHRDLKPHNLFLCVEPTGRIVTTKVLDFGISVLMERVLDLSRGLFVGTPNYMSPEHVAGVAVIDGRADVYGFGVLLYEALTGQAPFPGEPGPALFYAIMNQPALPVRSLCPELSSGMASLIEKAMAKQPDKRFASLNAMIAAFETELMVLGLGAPSPSALPGRSNGVVRSLAKNPRAQRPHQDTLLIYRLPREVTNDKPRQAGDKAEANAEGPVGIGSDTLTIAKPGFFSRFFARNRLSWLGWRAGLAMVLGMVLGIAVWKARHPSAFPELVNLGASSVVVELAPTIVPLATPDAMPEPPAAVAPEPAPGDFEATPESPAVVSDDKKPHRNRDVPVGSAVRIRGAAQEGEVGKPGRSVAQESLRPEPILAPPDSSATGGSVRAGSLSADDF